MNEDMDAQPQTKMLRRQKNTTKNILKSVERCENEKSKTFCKESKLYQKTRRYSKDYDDKNVKSRHI